MSFNTIQSLPFGDVAMSSVSSPQLGNALAVERVAFTPTLPNHMSVDFSVAYRIKFLSAIPIRNFSFDLTLAQCSARGDLEPGECLEAMSWEIGTGLVMFGTEDGEALRARMPWLRIEGTDYPVEFLPNGFRVAVPYVVPREVVEFHFVIAYNRLDRKCCSEWFAVDVPHAKLSELPVAEHISGAIAG